jgi:hypothetical protein
MFGGGGRHVEEVVHGASCYFNKGGAFHLEHFNLGLLIILNLI